MRSLALLALVAGCATPSTPVVAPVEEVGAATGTVSAPSPVARLAAPRARPSTASRSRSSALLAGTGSHLNWPALAGCESSSDPKADTGNGYYGAYQFTLDTWASVGGGGLPSAASLSEQTYRAGLLYRARGRQPWPVCGRFL